MQDSLTVNSQNLKIMCPAHVSGEALLSVYLGEKFTHSPMSQCLRAPGRALM